MTGSREGARRSPASRLADAALGLTFGLWGVAGPLLADPGERLAPARITLSLLHVGVAVLFVRRAPLGVRASPLELAAALPSFVLGGIAVSLAQPLSAWPRLAEVLFAVGGAAALASLFTLGRCFAVLPGARGLVTRGPYRLVRHPAYAAELVMLGGCALALGPLPGLGLLLLAVPLVIARILAEERPLRLLPGYRDYASRVPSRLVPFVW